MIVETKHFTIDTEKKTLFRKPYLYPYRGYPTEKELYEELATAFDSGPLLTEDFPVIPKTTYVEIELEPTAGWKLIDES